MLLNRSVIATMWHLKQVQDLLGDFALNDEQDLSPKGRYSVVLMLRRSRKQLRDVMRLMNEIEDLIPTTPPKSEHDSDVDQKVSGPSCFGDLPATSQAVAAPAVVEADRSIGMALPTTFPLGQTPASSQGSLELHGSRGSVGEDGRRRQVQTLAMLNVTNVPTNSPGSPASQKPFNPERPEFRTRPAPSLEAAQHDSLAL
ncbi:hypothetical protein BJ170DRAFT_395703 [Xylariales sp. AK1849]|nr:hypothetical protein BJ170DRAFT_395703 [Xylariales sp. AK1849]